MFVSGSHHQLFVKRIIIVLQIGHYAKISRLPFNDHFKGNSLQSFLFLLGEKVANALTHTPTHVGLEGVRDADQALVPMLFRSDTR